MSSINFAMQQQAQTNWCWAAVSSSVAAFYNAASTWTQCKIVNAERGLTDCCTNGSSASCNQGWNLSKALIRVGHYRYTLFRPVLRGDIDPFMDNNTPLGVVVQWTSGGAHALAISGHYISGTGYYAKDYVTVVDPWYGKSDVVYETLCKQYQGSGTWVESHYTKKA